MNDNHSTPRAFVVCHLVEGGRMTDLNDPAKPAHSLAEHLVQLFRLAVMRLAQTAANRDGVDEMNDVHHQAAIDSLVMDSHDRKIMGLLPERSDVAPATFPIDEVKVDAYPWPLYDIADDCSKNLMRIVELRAKAMAEEAGSIPTIAHVNAAFDSVVSGAVLRKVLGFTPKEGVRDHVEA